jgi:hypothetical protein
MSTLPPARRSKRIGLIKVFSAAEQDGTPEHDVPPREHALASPGTGRGAA